MQKSERQIYLQEGENLAREFGCPFFETSAKFKVNVDMAFTQSVREIRKQRLAQVPIEFQRHK
jgi:GTPase KRas protein